MMRIKWKEELTHSIIGAFFEVYNTISAPNPSSTA